MKMVLVSLVVLCFGLIGYFYKQKLKHENLAYKFLKDYTEFLKANINLFKENLVEINNKFIIMQKNKNANQYNIIVKNANSVVDCIKKIKVLVSDKFDFCLIETFFESLGKNDFEFEKERILSFENHIKEKEKITNENMKTKGEMWFKIMLAVGAIVGILLW